MARHKHNDFLIGTIVDIMPDTCDICDKPDRPVGLPCGAALLYLFCLPPACPVSDPDSL